MSRPDSLRPRFEMLVSATSVSQSPPWFNARFGAPRLLSIGIHGIFVLLALIPRAPQLPGPALVRQTTVMLFPDELQLTPVLLPQVQPSGGGGGGKRNPLPATRGVLPRGTDRQLAPPDPEPPKNPDPSLVVEPTIVAPQLALRPLDLSLIGDPNGVVGPPSSGAGDGGGIGNGRGHGDGKGDGPGAMDGQGGGCCDGLYIVGGGVTAPKVIFQVDPEYSEEARRARHEGTVVLEAIVRKDGHIDLVHLVRSLGFGLDQNAIDALRKWRFRPGTKNGTPVDVTINVEVRFSIR
jgi:protein TonB